MKNLYIEEEAKNNFKDWTKQGLEFLLHSCWVNKKLIKQIQSKLKKDI